MKEVTLKYTLETIDTAAAQFWEIVRACRLITFSGEMGAGKTTFVHHLCDLLGVTDAVSSPTFALINEYHFAEQGKDTIIFHLDWYRLRDAEEAINAGMEDCITQAKSGEAYCFVEWPEKAPELLTKPYAKVNIQTVSVGERTMTIEIIS